jgi:enoyl-CoA hydratase
LSDLVTYSRRERVGYLTLNRPERRNALNLEMFGALSDALTTLEEDPEARVAILRGAGPGFCAGMDLSSSGQHRYIEETSLWGDRERLRQQMDFWTRMWAFPKPIILQAHGFCLAGGLMLLMTSDLVIMADDCFLGWPRLPVGGGFLGPVFASLFGPRRAKEMDFIVGSRLTADTAREWGVVNRVVPAAALEAEAYALATRIAKTPPTLLALRKAAINQSMERAGFLETLRACAEWDALAHGDASVAEMRVLLAEHGVQGTIALFEGDDD